ncbi:MULTISPECIES: DUF5133 domain-containing protein [unclassified Streptomyces]|uniref:DUF5133 domain-containing protein n=1 Tax=unclassified Streptomyces TaxID=2593676 RepID=UPI002E12AB02|nr:DUF5133 domain-containing protein [Streptomyces sp. NBC_01197]WSS47708.1 DUF5133 domain-containing protein [Streptomyces sp. NBC_01180]
MLLPHPAILRNLVEQYETLVAQGGGQDAETRRQLEDITYTLCVSTGTLTAEAALTAAQQQLTAALADPTTPHNGAAGDVQLTA